MAALSRSCNLIANSTGLSPRIAAIIGCYSKKISIVDIFNSSCLTDEVYNHARIFIEELCTLLKNSLLVRIYSHNYARQGQEDFQMSSPGSGKAGLFMSDHYFMVARNFHELSDKALFFRVSGIVKLLLIPPEIRPLKASYRRYLEKHINTVTLESIESALQTDGVFDPDCNLQSGDKVCRRLDIEQSQANDAWNKTKALWGCEHTVPWDAIEDYVALRIVYVTDPHIGLEIDSEKALQEKAREAKVAQLRQTSCCILL